MKAIMPAPVIFCLILCSCDWLGDAAAWEAVFPGFPDAWRETFPAAHARVVVAGPDGSSETRTAPLDRRRFTVRLPKRRNSLVLVYCDTGRADDRLRPFGAVYPASADHGARTLALSVAGGFVAERLWRLAERGVAIADFNSERLLAFLAEEGGDPWDFDARLLETRLAERNFSVYAVKKLGTRAVTLRAAAGAWFDESPLSPEWRTEPDGRLEIPALAEGYHALFRRGSGDRLFLSLSAEEIVVFGGPIAGR